MDLKARCSNYILKVQLVKNILWYENVEQTEETKITTKQNLHFLYIITGAMLALND